MQSVQTGLMGSLGSLSNYAGLCAYSVSPKSSLKFIFLHVLEFITFLYILIHPPGSIYSNKSAKLPVDATINYTNISLSVTYSMQKLKNGKLVILISICMSFLA